MFRPSVAFSSGGLLATVGWLTLAVSLYAPVSLRGPMWTLPVLLIPSLLAVAYAILLAQGLRARTGGGFRSIAAVRRLFTNDAALAAGWLHYLAFDLFVGAWITREGLDAGIARLTILPNLFLTFFAGPVGRLIVLILRRVLAGRWGVPA